MQTTSLLPSYAELTDVLNKTHVNSNAAQVHGLLCGFICGIPEGKNKIWEEVIFGSNSKKNKETSEILQQLYETSYHQLSEFSFEFSLLLPDDDENINLRAEALGSWCQGFLTAIEYSKIPLQEQEEGSNEITEALDDLTEIAQIDFDEITTNEEDETAYFELTEYVRLTILMIFQELNSHPLENEEPDGSAQQ